MSGEATMKEKEVLHGSFEDSKAVDAFLVPLKDLMSTSPAVILRFGTDGVIKINAINTGRNLITMLEYDADVLEGFEVPQEYAFGIMELPEFYNLTRIFGNGFSLTLNDVEAIMESDGQQFVYYATQPEVIKEGPKSLNANLNWLAEFEWNPEDFVGFRKAMDVLKHNYIILEGKKGEKTLTMSVAEKDVRATNFKQVVDLTDPNTDTFRVVISKDAFRPVVSGSVSKMNVQVSDKLVSFSGKGEHHKVKNYISVSK